MIETLPLEFETLEPVPPESPNTEPSREKSETYLRQQYASGLAALQGGDYQEAIYLGHHQEARWFTRPEWASRFRSLVMESYFREKRYSRAEDYLWNLALRINREQLTPHLSLRYGDSLFLQGRYEDAVNWYKKSLDLLKGVTTPAGYMSRFYYAEALFQTGHTEEAKSEYMTYRQQSTLPSASAVSELVEYRLMQCNLSNKKDATPVIAFQNFAETRTDTPLGMASSLQWVRLSVRSNQFETAGSARHILERIEGSSTISRKLKNRVNALLVLLQWMDGDKASMNQTFAQMAKSPFFTRTDDPDAIEADNIVAWVLAQEADSYRRLKDDAGFLVLCDSLRNVIQKASMPQDALIEVSRSYTEVGMTHSAARLMEQLFFYRNFPENQRNRIGIELARVYTLLSEHELLDKTMKLIRPVAKNDKEGEMYHVVSAAYAITQKNYSQCTEHMNHLLTMPISGDHFFKYAAQGALCARKSDDLVQAQKFMDLLGDTTEPKEGVTEDFAPSPFQQRVEFLAASGAYEALEQVLEIHADAISTLPLETVFSLVDTYHRIHQPDRAEEIWKKYGEPKAPSEDFKRQYRSLVDLFGKTELIPQSSL